MIPRLSPMVTACVRSFAPSLSRMLPTWLFTVSSRTESWAAISLFAFPSAISQDSSSRTVNWSSVAQAKSAATRAKSASLAHFKRMVAADLYAHSFSRGRARPL